VGGSDYGSCRKTKDRSRAMTVIDTAPAAAGRAAHDGIALAWDLAGDGPPLVLIAGLNADRSFWAMLRPELAACTTIAFDHRDIGASDLARAPYDTAAMARDTLAVMDAAGVARADVLGHSMGGMVAQELALAAPGRVRRLVLANTIARNSLFTRELLALLSDLRRQTDDRAFYGILHVFGLGRGFLQTVPLGAAVDEILAAGPAQDAAGTIRQLEACLAHDAHDRLGALAAPTLVLSSRDDAFFGTPEAESLAAAIPNARHLVLDGGHCPMIEAPAAFAQTVTNFLAAN
jgi:pimeloyl-ACP methyl ester carboxylesterase